MNSFVPPAWRRTSPRKSSPVRIASTVLVFWFLCLIHGSINVASVLAFPCAQSAPETTQDDGLMGEWIKMTPTGARASFEMPTKPRYVERVFSPLPDKPPIKVRLHLTTVADGNLTYVFSYHDLHSKPADRKTINDALNGAVQGSVVNVLGQLVAPEELGLKSNPVAIQQAGKPGRQYVCRFIQSKKPYIVTARVFLVDERLYQLNCIMAEDIYDPNLAVKFLKSFSAIAVIDDLPPRPRVAETR